MNVVLVCIALGSAVLAFSGALRLSDPVARWVLAIQGIVMMVFVAVVTSVRWL